MSDLICPYCGSTLAIAPQSLVLLTPPVPAPPPAPPPSSVAALPFAPAAYVLPSGATGVRSGAELATALSATTPRDIILASGLYDGAGPFVNANGHRLYAEILSGAVFKAGLVFGGNSGPGGGSVQGVTFDIESPAKTFQNSAINIWGGGGRGSQIRDCAIGGRTVLGTGVLARQVEGLVIRRIAAYQFTDYGVFVDPNFQPYGTLSVATPPILEDIDVAGVKRAAPGSSNGTAEACIWLGTTCTLRRARTRDAGWMGIWTGSSNTGSVHEDLDVDGAATGIYLEHFTTRSTFRHFRIGPNVRTGFTCEWADPGWAPNPETGLRCASVDNVIDDGRIESAHVGVYMDEGTTRTTARRISFVGQSGAAIVDYKGVGNSYPDNDYSRVGLSVSTEHL